MKNLIIGMFVGSFLTCAIAAGPAIDQLANWKRDSAIQQSIIFAMAEGDVEKVNNYTLLHCEAWENLSGNEFEGWMTDLLAKMGDKSVNKLTIDILNEVGRMIQEWKKTQPITPTQPQRYDV